MSDGREHEQYVVAKQHVADAEARVAKQRGIIQARRATGRDTSAAQRLLYAILQSLGHMQEYLRMIEAELTRNSQ
jgi:hypothetical protein